METGMRELEFGAAYRVAPTPDFLAEAEVLLGGAALL